MSKLNDNPFEEPAFLEGLEAAGYLQRLDTSESRITARYQHALTKMKFAAHSEEFLTRAGVRKVHGSTVQFFNETPVSDPFVHVMVGSLPPAAQALITPVGCPTSGWTPIGSPDEADGTVHFTVSHAGYWPLTVVFDANPQDMARENDPRWKSAEPLSDSDSEQEYYGGSTRYGRGGIPLRGASRQPSRAGSYAMGTARASSRSRVDSMSYDRSSALDYSGAGSGRGSSSAARRRASMAAESSSDSSDDADYGRASSAYGRASSAYGRSNSQRRDSMRSTHSRY
ncbi:hypothetical protein T439DRAFT_377771 [Meredithblackwellia eburnea MCA 4105]